MKWLLLFLIYLPVWCTGQIDTVYIHFTEDDDIYTDCSTIFAANGLYFLEHQELPKIKLSGAIPVYPLNAIEGKTTDGLYNRTLTFTSKSIWAKQLAYFEVPSNYYVQVSYSYVDSIAEANNISKYVPKQLEGLNIYKHEPSQFVIDSLERLFIIGENERIRISDSIYLAENGHRRSYSTGIINGMYIPTYYLQKVPFFKIHPKIKDSLDSSYRALRKNDIAPIVNKILEPYYFSKYEVSNQEYREFIQWVRDSIARDLIYFGLEDDEESSEWINYTDLYLIGPAIVYEDGYVDPPEYEDFDPSDRDINRSRFSLNWDKDFEYDDPNLVRILEKMYLPQHARYYYRHRNIDTRKLIYRFNDSDSVFVYPDTLGFKDILYDSIHLKQMYWHPKFDHYPAVNLTMNQIKAFCHWKEDRINEELNLTGSRVKVSIPTISQYEFALKSTLPIEERAKTYNAPNYLYATFDRNSTVETNTFLTKVEQGIYKHNRRDSLDQRKSKQLFNRWLESNQTGPFHFLNGNVSEIVLDQVIQSELDHYGIANTLATNELNYAIGGNYGLGVKTKSDHQFNALFYKTLIKNQESSPRVGFRLVYTLEELDGNE